MPETPGLRLDLAYERGGFALALALEVPAGQTVAVMGPSGAGKSTLLALVAGLVRPQRGRVACEGEVWCDTEARIDRPPESRRVGLVFQDFALFPHLTARDNVAYGVQARGAGRQQARRTAEQWLERLRLLPAAGRRVQSLSGGERQRVALARALASGARVLLLDEPFGSLDVATRSAVRSELRRTLREVGLATLLVTHDAVDALALGDRLAVLEEGRLVQVGTHEELALAPRSPFTAQVAGVNLFPAVVPAGGGLKLARAGALVFHVLADEVAGEAFVVFAPSDVMLSTQRPSGSPQNVFETTLRELRPAQDRVWALLDAAGLVLTAEITREAAAALELVAGGRVWASVKATAIRVYA